mmetsp:Transcript_78628/g.179972  ORF Transcript_78628/g.179972 Transcript_78628/m.179972 type:complete len:201 (+) Transcript_78628:219-821(+)
MSPSATSWAPGLAGSSCTGVTLAVFFPFPFAGTVSNSSVFITVTRSSTPVLSNSVFPPVIFRRFHGARVVESHAASVTTTTSPAINTATKMVGIGYHPWVRSAKKGTPFGVTHVLHWTPSSSFSSTQEHATSAISCAVGCLADSARRTRSSRMEFMPVPFSGMESLEKNSVRTGSALASVETSFPGTCKGMSHDQSPLPS